MKKNVFYSASLMAALSLGLAVSCAREETPAKESEITNPSELVTISAEIPADPAEEGTKVSLTPGTGGKGLALAWETTDKLTVIGTETQQFSIVEEGLTAHKATFTGTAPAGSSFDVLYPGQTYATKAALLARSYTSQVQDGNGSTSHLEWNALFEGVSDYSTLTFSGADCKQNGALKFYLQLPEDFTKVYSVALKAPTAIFSTTNAGDATTDELKLSLVTGAADGITLDSDKVLTAYMMVSWNENVIAGGTELTVEVWGDQQEPWVRKQTVGESGFTIAGGKVTLVQLNKSGWTEPMFWAGDGKSEATAFEIKTVKHLQNMNTVVTNNAGASKLYFKLVDDIDMTGVEWTYMSSSTGNPWPINFNGNGHTISNFSAQKNSASLFGALIGEVYDLNFKDAVIKTKATEVRGGLLAYRAGSATNPVTISRIKVDGLQISGGDYKANPPLAIGGLVGLLTNGTVEDCHISGLDMTASTGGVGGGIVGLTYGTASSITGCYVSGTIAGPSSDIGTAVGIGGIVGYDHVGGSTFASDTAAVTITTYAKAGGIVGNIIAASTNITDCIASGSITSNNSEAAANMGGILGEAGEAVTISGCKSSVDVKGYSQVGGIVGLVSAASEISNCSSSGNIIATYTVECYAGGIAGYLRGSISKCFSTCSISGNRFCGGISGYGAGTVSISECWFGGSITISNYGGGGIIGGSVKNTLCTVSNCYSKGTLSHSNYSGFVGGIAGFLAGAKFTMTDCYSAMSISTSIAAAKAPAGLVGGHNNATAEWDIARCLAWNDKLDFHTQTANDNGVIVGQFHSKASEVSTSAKNCWYKHGIDYSTGISGRTLGNDEDITAGGNTHYDGKDAGEGVTCSAKAKAIGWDESIWDLTSGELPILKNVKE